jgi:hypothetical protein
MRAAVITEVNASNDVYELTGNVGLCCPYRDGRLLAQKGLIRRENHENLSSFIANTYIGNADNVTLEIY